MDVSHCIEPGVNIGVDIPEFSPKQIIALYLKFNPEAFCYVSTINYRSLDYCFSYLTSNELYNSQCYNMV